LSLSSSMVVWFLWFNLRKDAKMKNKMIPKKKKMKAYEKLKPCLHCPQTNNILLITWGQTTSEEMLKFLIIGPKIFWAQLLV
jgi:hypothetical protein